MRQLCALIALGLLSPALVAAECSELGVAHRLLGRWVANAGTSVIVEHWWPLGPDTFEGLGETRRDGVVTGYESLRLVQMGGEVFYIAKVKHNPLPVAFRLTRCGTDRLVFENATHDFPRRIEYTFLSGSGFTVRVSDGAERGFELVFRELVDE